MLESMCVLGRMLGPSLACVALIVEVFWLTLNLKAVFGHLVSLGWFKMASWAFKGGLVAKFGFVLRTSTFPNRHQNMCFTSFGNCLMSFGAVFYYLKYARDGIHSFFVSDSRVMINWLTNVFLKFCGLPNISPVGTSSTNTRALGGAKHCLSALVAGRTDCQWCPVAKLCTKEYHGICNDRDDIPQKALIVKFIGENISTF